MTQLYEMPNRTWVRILDNVARRPPGDNAPLSERIFFDHLDGMYSYCKTENGDVIHLVAWQEVEPA